MEIEPIELRVAGHCYHVVSSADRATLERLASVVEQRLTEMVGSARPVPVQSLLLVAMALARDLENERERTLAAERRTREMLTSVLARIDDALGCADENGEALPSCSGGPDTGALGGSINGSVWSVGSGHCK